MILRHNESDSERPDRAISSHEQAEVAGSSTPLASRARSAERSLPSGVRLGLAFAFRGDLSGAWRSFFDATENVGDVIGIANLLLDRPKDDLLGERSPDKRLLSPARRRSSPPARPRRRARYGRSTPDVAVMP
jgi:hypothetical protein